ncbi:uncharacterized protein LOC135811644 isoform X1 [Sycon ciliatum]|uniref:uncharacterized protein LOC135811644 isoform X1 n=1 Tax=Sycon ciliatum TaxID=27933 RepID=UPI0031F71279
MAMHRELFPCSRLGLIISIAAAIHVHVGIGTRAASLPGELYGHWQATYNTTRRVKRTVRYFSPHHRLPKPCRRHAAFAAPTRAASIAALVPSLYDAQLYATTSNRVGFTNITATIQMMYELNGSRAPGRQCQSATLGFRRFLDVFDTVVNQTARNSHAAVSRTSAILVTPMYQRELGMNDRSEVNITDDLCHEYDNRNMSISILMHGYVASAVPVVLSEVLAELKRALKRALRCAGTGIIIATIVPDEHLEKKVLHGISTTKERVDHAAVLSTGRRRRASGSNIMPPRLQPSPCQLQSTNLAIADLNAIMQEKILMPKHISLKSCEGSLCGEQQMIRHISWRSWSLALQVASFSCAELVRPGRLEQSFVAEHTSGTAKSTYIIVHVHLRGIHNLQHTGARGKMSPEANVSSFKTCRRASLTNNLPTWKAQVRKVLVRGRDSPRRCARATIMYMYMYVPG